MPSLHGNTAFGYEFAFLFAGFPAIFAVPLHYRMIPLAANLRMEENTLDCVFIAARLFQPIR